MYKDPNESMFVINCYAQEMNVHPAIHSTFYGNVCHTCKR